MEKIYVKDLKNYVGQEISFSGFVETIRDKKWVMLSWTLTDYIVMIMYL